MVMGVTVTETAAVGAATTALGISADGIAFTTTAGKKRLPWVQQYLLQARQGLPCALGGEQRT
jgi:hypothetical protein